MIFIRKSSSKFKYTADLVAKDRLFYTYYYTRVHTLAKKGVFMCTAIAINGRNFYFGRTLDSEYDFSEKIVFAGRNFPFFKNNNHTQRYAILGMAKLFEGYPLFFDGVNEKGLCIAALNYTGCAHYQKDRDGIAPYELIPLILQTCKSIDEAKEVLRKTNITDRFPSKDLGTASLHFLIADKSGAIAVEPDKNGLNIYENPHGVLTNSPCYPYHAENLRSYLGLSSAEAKNRFSEKLELNPDYRGTGALGLPGDSSSPSRFVRSCFYKFNSTPLEGEEIENISRFFHIIGTSKQLEGAVKVKDGSVKTRYTCCINADTGMYYYTTYENSRVSAVSLSLEDVDSSDVSVFSLLNTEDILLQNKISR